MYLKIFIIIFYSALNYNTLSANCLKFNIAKPKYVKSKKAYKNNFTKKNGEFKLYRNIQQYLKVICEHRSNEDYSFKSSKMYSFVITKKCNVLASISAKNGAKVKHIALTSKEIIGGGEIKCINKSSIFITNNSSEYCFKMSPVKYLIKSLLKSKIKEKNIFIKFKQKKFCANKKNRIVKYKNIINKKYLDLGYKKNHIFNASEFLKRIELN